MSRLWRGAIVAGAHLAIVMGLVAKYTWDREHLPRVWVRALHLDPDFPIRGRYVSLSLVFDSLDEARRRLGERHRFTERAGAWVLTPAIPFYVPEHAPDPAFRRADEELWAEVSVTRKGSPRPIRLGLKKAERITPFDVR